jgi:TolC family type I secretion outer membrane protein
MKKFPMKLCAAAIGAALATQSVMASGLQAELVHLRESNPLLRASDFAVKAAQARQSVARAEWLPRVTLTADGGPEKITSTNYNGSVPGDPNTTDLHRRKWGIGIEQNLYNGGRTVATNTIADLSLGIKRAEYSATSQEVLLEAVVSYLQVLKNHIQIKLATINEGTTKQQLDLERKRVEKGGGIVVDEMQAATRLQIVRERRVIYEQEMRDALAGYEQVFGQAPDMEKFQDLDVFTARMPATLEDAITVALEGNPRLQASKLTSTKAMEAIKLERAGYLPTIDLSVTHNRDKNAAGLYKKEENSILVEMSWNLFAGGENRYLTQAATFDQLEAAELEASARNRMLESVRMAWNQYRKGVERVELLESATQSARSVMNGRKRLRDLGKETALAVLDAEVEYFGILANKVNAMIEARIGSYRLLSTLGLLNIQELNLDGEKMDLPVRSIDDALSTLLAESN